MASCKRIGHGEGGAKSDWHRGGGAEVGRKSERAEAARKPPMGGQGTGEGRTEVDWHRGDGAEVGWMPERAMASCGWTGHRIGWRPPAGLLRANGAPDREEPRWTGTGVVESR